MFILCGNVQNAVCIYCSKGGGMGRREKQEGKRAEQSKVFSLLKLGHLFYLLM